MKARRTKLFGVIVAIVLAVAALFSFAACDFAVKANKELDHIELNTEHVQKDFYVGDPFNYDGLIVTAFYDDGSSLELESGYYVRPISTEAIGEKDVRVIYGTVDDTYTVHVRPNSVNAIRVDSDEVQKDYYVGDTFNEANLKVFVELENGDEMPLTSDYTVSVNNLDEEGKLTLNSNEVTVSYHYDDEHTFEATFDIHVQAVVVDGITVDASALNGKTFYAGQEEYDFTGVVVDVHYNNGNTAKLNSGAEGLKFSHVEQDNTLTVTVEYEGQSATFTLTLTPVTVDRLEVTTHATEEYDVGTDLDLSLIHI